MKLWLQRLFFALVGLKRQYVLQIEYSEDDQPKER